MKVEKETEEEEFIRKEYKSSNYFRRFNLPDTADKDKIDANLDNGILKITIPKKEVEEPQKKRIEIK
ncbi:MAG: Hsp20 family protein [Promethearchaeota archaeon]|nr:MAG: Hsp20 family protein [Candidatus Lokiarchaeota archaeon]